jgi:hypothetical protein
VRQEIVKCSAGTLHAFDALDSIDEVSTGLFVPFIAVFGRIVSLTSQRQRIPAWQHVGQTVPAWSSK